MLKLRRLALLRDSEHACTEVYSLTKFAMHPNALPVCMWPHHGWPCHVVCIHVGYM